MLKDFTKSAGKHPGLRDVSWVFSHKEGQFKRERGFVIDVGQPGFANVKTFSEQGFAISLMGRKHNLYPSLSPSLLADAYCPDTALPQMHLRKVIAVCAEKPKWADYHVRPWLRWCEIKRRMADCAIVYTDLDPAHPLLSWVSQSGRLVLSPGSFPGLPLPEQFKAPLDKHRVRFSEITNDTPLYRDLVSLQQGYFLRLALEHPPYTELEL